MTRFKKLFVVKFRMCIKKCFSFGVVFSDARFNDLLWKSSDVYLQMIFECFMDEDRLPRYFSFSSTFSYECVLIVINSFMEKYHIKTFTLGTTILISCEIVWLLYFTKTAELQCSLNTNIQLFCVNYQM